MKWRTDNVIKEGDGTRGSGVTVQINDISSLYVPGAKPFLNLIENEGVLYPI